MIEVEFVGQDVLVHIPKALLVMSKSDFVRAIKRGKAYRRREQRAKREKVNL